MKNVLVLQSGGPTAAINSTVAGVVERALISEKVEKIYGSIYGIKGLIEDNITEIGEILSSPTELSRLIHTPSAALGSARVRLPEVTAQAEEYKLIFANLEKYNIGYLICIGGNDSMDTVHKLSTYAKEFGIDSVKIMGAPKTIDNDLMKMDHSPGFASAARYVATTFCEIWADIHVYDIPAVTIVEVMGRHTGWLTASASFANTVGKGPDLIYLPEVPFDTARFISDIKSKLEEKSAVLIAVSEGLCHENGKFVSEDEGESKLDAFGHTQLSGTAKILEHAVARELKVKVRSIELNLMQRASATLTSSTDLIESRMLGATSLDRALNGVSGEVSVLNRVSNCPYRIKYSTVPVAEVANLEKTVPREWINTQGNNVNEKMLEYITPLITLEGQELFCNNLPNYLQFIR